MTVPPAVTAFLKAKNCHRIHPDWISQCVEYICSSSNRQLSAPELAELVYDQFLQTDLADMGLPSLPPNITDAHDIIVGNTQALRTGGSGEDGGIVLQVNDVMEVGVSVQHLLDCVLDLTPQKSMPRLAEVDDEEEVVKKVGKFPRKMLKLILTDGMQSLPAMEFSFLPDFSLQIPIGMKVVVRNAKLRRGVLLLKQQNVECLGGSVPELNEEDVLTRLERTFSAMLGLPPPDPPKPGAVAELQPKIRASAQRADQPQPAVAKPTDPPTNNSNARRPAPTANTAFAMDDDMDDSFELDDNDLNALAAVEEEFIRGSQSRHSSAGSGVRDGGAPHIAVRNLGGSLDGFEGHLRPSNHAQLYGSRAQPIVAPHLHAPQGSGRTSTAAGRTISGVSIKRDTFVPPSPPPVQARQAPTASMLARQFAVAPSANNKRSPSRTDPPTLADAIAMSATPSPAKKVKLQGAHSPIDDAPRLSGVSASDIRPRLPIRYLCDLESIINARTSLVVRVKAHICERGQLRLLKNQQKVDQYVMNVRLDDGTAFVNVLMANDLVAEYMGITAAEFRQITMAADKTPMKQHVNMLDTQIRQMDRVMELDLSGCAAGKPPVMVSTTEMEVADCLPWMDDMKQEM
ncbi:recQ-mediated genome instability protein 1 [Rhizophlyctis rosea]|uniref:RecQ-mediated genome instability protein 1 n=1 Tax=Rhizophlyctis rosea TaxID=64517 RepID=A0AAD5SGM7_9FUNG|nr:recQ-mediated genome instability protein 1 [Rhizophlyctis rosea]